MVIKEIIYLLKYKSQIFVTGCMVPDTAWGMEAWVLDLQQGSTKSNLNMASNWVAYHSFQ